MHTRGQLVRRVRAREGEGLRPGRWPDDVPAVAQLLTDGLDLAAGVTFLVGENGSGKSTIVEALAEEFGLNAEGGTRNARHVTAQERSDLTQRIQLERVGGSSRWGFFLRAETMHGHYSYLDEIGDAPSLHLLSHGESFLEVLRTRFADVGFYVLDEPEAALSFAGTLTLLATLNELVRAGSQVLCATHSPVLASLPGATIVELDETGMHATSWGDLDLVRHWRNYLADPQRYLRHLID